MTKGNKGLEERVRQLEQAVYGQSTDNNEVEHRFDCTEPYGFGVRYIPPITKRKQERKIKTTLDMAAELRQWVRSLKPEDTYILQGVYSPQASDPETDPEGEEEGAVSGSFQLMRLGVIEAEEADEDIARLCNALASKQRVGIMRILAQGTYTSGELAELTGMAGGHLHHHLRDLLSLRLLGKDKDNRYFATQEGVYAYMTVGAMHRRLVRFARHPLGD